MQFVFKRFVPTKYFFIFTKNFNSYEKDCFVWLFCGHFFIGGKL